MNWDRNSNVTVIEDNIHSGLDVSYTNDNLGRLTTAEEGTWGGSSISSRTRQQNWTLDQVGNWEIAKLDLDGDNNWNETDEYDDARTHNVANELTARDTNDDATDDHDLVYDGVGNLTDDDEAYEYVYDVWGRLRKIKDTGDQSLVEEFWYNGLGYRITFHADTEPDGDVDVNDPKYHLIYDERWRLVATYRADDDNPKEAFVSHQAGLDGAGGSSYIDSVILRQRDANSGWVNAADGTMEQRRYYCQNWRNDVSVMLTSAGVMVEWVKYSAYGVPIGLPGADTNSDGACDATDITQIQTWIDAPAYDVRGDVDLDGDVDATDKSTAQSSHQGTTSGWRVLSADNVANRAGYAGYQKDINLDISHVRNRVLEPHLGRWTRRDPLGYIDGMSLYEYVRSRSITNIDPMAFASNSCASAMCIYYDPPYWIPGHPGVPFPKFRPSPVPTTPFLILCPGSSGALTFQLSCNSGFHGGPMGGEEAWAECKRQLESQLRSLTAKYRCAHRSSCPNSEPCKRQFSWTPPGYTGGQEPVIRRKGKCTVTMTGGGFSQTWQATCDNVSVSASIDCVCPDSGVE